MKQALPSRPVRFLTIFISLLFIIGLLFFSLRSIITKRDFFEKQYTQLGHAANMGMSTEHLVDATMRMIDYMEGRYDSIDLMVTVDGASVSMFNQREQDHMVDVRVLYQAWRAAAYAFIGLFVLMAIWLLWRKRAQYFLTRAFLHASLAFLLLLLALGAWVFFDFNSFWTAFHHLFFTNDLWLLDPATSRMINMMPLELFFSIVLSMAARFLLVWGCLLVFAGVLHSNSKKKRPSGAAPSGTAPSGTA